ncbi:hypothetical protein SAMN04489712_11373 [Thermomonospora echinospora]|uniref:Uncharacterized protein n=1 Tax=Thermomonospora echinospora TaxID=1992 RepID=A0A1H6D561_9ACTN|nr:hypothetical protein [Thermomonospora echinospora]SEG80391.1 hypothetical protein SAMN04489712_11373 [Thermomonospora echinospora]
MAAGAAVPGVVLKGGDAQVLCLTCRRVRPALSPAEYTVARARLITRHGLCMCLHTGRRPPSRPETPETTPAPSR